MNVVIPQNDYEIPEGTYDEDGIAQLLRKHRRSSATVGFLADMIETGDGSRGDAQLTTLVEVEEQSILTFVGSLVADPSMFGLLDSMKEGKPYVASDEVRHVDFEPRRGYCEVNVTGNTIYIEAPGHLLEAVALPALMIAYGTAEVFNGNALLEDLTEAQRRFTKTGSTRDEVERDALLAAALRIGFSNPVLSNAMADGTARAESDED